MEEEKGVVVLVNKYSASGSEALSGALQDHLRAVVAGETTFGKGSFDRLYPLAGGGGIYLTVGRWYTPGGRLKASQPGVPFMFSASGGELTRHCVLEDFDLTAHASRESLVDFVGVVSPRAVLLGHGGATARQWVEEQIRDRHPKIKILQPEPGVSVEV